MLFLLNNSLSSARTLDATRSGHTLRIARRRDAHGGTLFLRARGRRAAAARVAHV